MLTQMRNQDPTQPIDSSQMLAQQAQFASLEQMQNLNTNLSVLLAMQNVTQATNLLGKTVSGADTNGQAVLGTVAGVSFADGMSMLKVDIGGGVYKDVKLPDVVEVGI
jgi:flagellar basal-body rod modification protein FlgD